MKKIFLLLVLSLLSGCLLAGEFENRDHLYGKSISSICDDEIELCEGTEDVNW